MGLRSGEYCGRYRSVAPADSIASRTPGTLCDGRLSIMTISRRLSVGTRNCFTHSTKVSPFIAPSITKGATMRSWRSPATNVMVFQCPCGAYPISRRPRGQRPRSLTMLVLVAVSSIKTSRAGSSKPCSRIQRRRAHATSARCCSAAYRLFFKADPVSKEKAPHRAAAARNTRFLLRHHHLVQRQVRLRGDQVQKPLLIFFQRRYAAAVRLGRRTSGFAPAPQPPDDRTRAHPKLVRNLTTRGARFNLFNSALPKVIRIRPRHPISPSESMCRHNTRASPRRCESLRFYRIGICSSPGGAQRLGKNS
jgi:hypothetical protein